MRAPLVLCGLVLLAGCGNWSNEDLVFLAALPDRTQLESKLPPSGGQALSPEPSQVWTFTRDASREFNGTLFDLLDLLERVRTLPPTTREPDRRVWGPWRDRADRRFEIRVVIARREGAADPAAGAVYAYAAELRRVDGGTWTPVIEGDYSVTGTIREGVGHVLFDVDAYRGLGRAAPELVTLSRIEVSYQTAPPPIVVDLRVVGSPVATFDELRYAYLEAPDGAGAMRFHATSDVVPGPGIEALDALSAWRPDGTGRAEVSVTGGDAPAAGAAWQECWDPDGVLTFVAQSWGVPDGDAAACPSWDGLPAGP